MAQRTLEELKKKAAPALQHPELVEIVRNAPTGVQDKINLSWIYRQAELYVHSQTKDLQQTKRLATAARFLGMLRRDFHEEFEALARDIISHANQTNKPPLRNAEIELPQLRNMEFITRKTEGSYYCAIRFLTSERSLHEAWGLCRRILEAMFQSVEFDPDATLPQEHDHIHPRGTGAMHKAQRIQEIKQIKTEGAQWFFEQV